MTMTQCTTLLSDIQNFVETREISTIYYNKYQDLLQYEENADKNWLVSDIRNKNKKSIFCNAQTETPQIDAQYAHQI